MDTILPKIGYSSKTTRDVVLGPQKYLGIGLRHLASEQGVQQSPNEPSKCNEISPFELVSCPVSFRFQWSMQYKLSKFNKNSSFELFVLSRCWYAERIVVDILVIAVCSAICRSKIQSLVLASSSEDIGPRFKGQVIGPCCQ